MSGTDPVTYDNLEKWCDKRREECKMLRTSEAENAALRTAGERRADVKELSDTITAMRNEWDAIKKTFASNYVLQPKIMLVLSVGLIAVGIVFKEVGKIVVSALTP